MQLISDWSLVFNRTRLLRIIKVTVPRRHFRLATTYARKVARDTRWPNFQDCVSKSNFYSKSMKRKSLTNNLSQWTKYCKISIPVLKPLSFATFFLQVCELRRFSNSGSQYHQRATSPTFVNANGSGNEFAPNSLADAWGQG